MTQIKNSEKNVFMIGAIKVLFSGFLPLIFLLIVMFMMPRLIVDDLSCLAEIHLYWS